MDKYVTTEQAAKHHSVSPRRIRALCEKGRFPGAMRIGKFWAIPTASLNAVTFHHKPGRPRKAA